MELCSYLLYYKHFVLGDIDLFNRQIQSKVLTMRVSVPNVSGVGSPNVAPRV